MARLLAEVAKTSSATEAGASLHTISMYLTRMPIDFCKYDVLTKTWQQGSERVLVGSAENENLKCHSQLWLTKNAVCQ